jgi:hypothetical protein
MNTDQNIKCGSTEFLNFSDALHHLRWGDKIARRAWKGEMYLHIDYIKRRIIVYIDGRVPTVWSGNEGILAEDWYVLSKNQ